MTDTDELATLRAQLKRLERRQAQAAAEAEDTRKLLLARLLVVIATVAMFLSVSMAWYADVEVDDEEIESASGWLMLSEMAGSGEGAFVFGGVYGWIVVLVALVAGASVFTIDRRWFPITLSTLLALLAAGLLLINMQEMDGDDEKLAGLWCAILVIVGAAFAWGNLAAPLREVERAKY